MTHQPARILVVDDEADMVETCRRILARRGHDVVTASCAETAEELLAHGAYDLLIADVVMPGRDGLELARRARARVPDLPVLIITAHATVESAMSATRDGAFDYIPKPFTMEELETATERALESRQARDNHAARQSQADAALDFRPLVGASPPMLAMAALLRKVCLTDASVLVSGESGTGKELVARLIHANGRRRQRRFVPLDCAAMPETLLESELFGAERGAYTGADSMRVGLVEYADGGTLFLDELANLPIATQAKLLRLLQERSFRRVGGTREVVVDIRVIAATHCDLRDLVRAGRFREDLYYRLNVVAVALPPLRDRHGDVRTLSQHFVTELAAASGRPVRGVSSAAMMVLERHTWPGNVRELRNVIEHAVSMTESSQLMPADLPPLLTGGAPASDCGESFRGARRRALAEFEAAYIRGLLQESGGNVSRAAERADMKRTVLHRLLARHGIDPQVYRPRSTHATRGEQ